MKRGRHQDLLQETLSRLLASLQRHVRALNRDVTTETVHQARVAIRRLRVALRALKPYLVPALRRRLTAALRQFTSDLETPREADTRVLVIGELIANHPGADHQQARRILLESARQRTRARQALRHLVTTTSWKQRLSQLQQDSRKQLVMTPSDASLLMIRDVLAHRQRRLRQALRHIGHDPRELHRLRLSIKATRYLDEDFGSLMSMSPDQELKSLRRLQNRLGEFHDNWCLKRWLRRHRPSMSITGDLCDIIDTHQARLLKVISQLGKTVRQTNI
jgi:triphosphatase